MKKTLKIIGGALVILVLTATAFVAGFVVGQVPLGGSGIEVTEEYVDVPMSLVS